MAGAVGTAARCVRHLSCGKTKYAGIHTVTMMPGDGVGPELMASVKKVLGELRTPVVFEEVDLETTSGDVDKKVQAALHSLRRNGVGLKGIVTTPVGPRTGTSLNVLLRGKLDMFASVTECRNMPNVNARHKNVDLVVVRQNTEGEYKFLEHEISPGVVESLKVMTRENSVKIAKFAFDYATQNGRKKVTAVHKANIMKQGDGLFLQCCKEVAEQYPNIAFDAMIVDNCSMQLVGRPQQFDVLVTPNLYGNIVSNIGAGLIGGAGLVPGANMGTEFAVFEPGARHAASDIAGTNAANPTAMLLAAAGMLKHIGLPEYSHVVRQAVENVYSKQLALTKDLGGSSTTSEFTEAVISQLTDPAQVQVA